MKNVTEQSFELDVLKSSLPVLVDFYTTWCGPCIATAPILNKLATEYEGRVTICKVNAAEEDKLAGSLKVFSVPCFMFFKDGKATKSMIGLQSEKALREALDSLLAE